MSFEGIQSIQSRISQIESKVQSISNMGTPPAPAQIPSQPLNFQEIMKSKMQDIKLPGESQTPSPQTATPCKYADVKPLAQNNSISCGQTSVAMCINSLTGKHMIDSDINSKYGFGLLEALNTESKSAGVDWKDGGTISKNSWGLIEQKVNKEGLPVIVGLNGPEFSASGRGHIVTITKIEGDTVHYADPATGTMKTTTKQAMNTAPSHPDGNFIFYASRQGNEVPPMMAANNFSPYMLLNKQNI